MKRNLSSRQMINAELASRSFNKKSAKILKNYTPEQEQDNLRIAFHCECANIDCEERILLTIEEYEKIHQNQARFVVAKGHDEPKVEKIKSQTKNVTIVDKYALS